MKRSTVGEPRSVRLVLITMALVALFVLVVLPLIVVFEQAFAEGWSVAWEALSEPDTLAAMRLTLLVAAISVAVNTLCGVAASWCIARFVFPGRSLLIAIIELPLAISPVISGLVWVLLFGAQGWFGPMLARAGVEIVFAVPGLILATVFVSVPYVARQLLPAMQAQGRAEEEAAATLGAGGLAIFWRVTLPSIRWALLQGVLLCNARAMGEFGAVSVVSGRVRGETLTVSLQVEALYNDFRPAAAFAVAGLLAMLALLTLIARTLLAWRTGTVVGHTAGAEGPG